MSEKQYFTLQQVSESIRKTIAQRYSSTYWVKAEMYKLNETRKGHCYPELVQKENETIIAEMRGTIWKGNFDRISAKFVSVVNEPLKEGLELLFEVKIVYHPIFGMGLDIIDIDPVFTLGALQRERQETLERLAKEGILNANQQLPFPVLPQRLAIISQANSKGYSDFILLLNGHPKRYKFFTFLFEAILQGDGAVQSIIAQLNRIARIKDHFDAVLIIRGGGGEVGMHCYNNYELAKTVATFPLPVLTGVGHSTNMTVCEMIAYNNGITPSDLAYWFREIMVQLDEPLDYFKEYLPQLLDETFEKKSLDLKNNAEFIQNATTSRLLHEALSQQKIQAAFAKSVTSFSNRQQQLISAATSDLLRFVSGKQQESRHLLANTMREVQFQSLKRTVAEENKVVSLRSDLSKVFLRKISGETDRITQLEKQVELMNPENVLKRGYSIVTNEKGIISRKNQPKKGEKLVIIADGISTEATTLTTEKR